MFVTGAAAGVALVVACNQAKNANASPSDCAVWQYANAGDITMLQETAPVTLGTVNENPPLTVYATELTGWEPFAVDPDNGMQVRRCKP
jgi:hypothetical protein